MLTEIPHYISCKGLIVLLIFLLLNWGVFPQFAFLADAQFETAFINQGIDCTEIVNVIKDHILADRANVLNSVACLATGYMNINLEGHIWFSDSNIDRNQIKNNIPTHPTYLHSSLNKEIQNTVEPSINLFG